LTIDSSTNLSRRFPDLQDRIDSASEDVLKEVKKRRDEAEKKLEESRTRIGPIEREKKKEKFPPK